MPTASSAWRVDWTQPADTARGLVFRTLLVLPLSALPLGALFWVIQRARADFPIRDDFGNLAFVEMILTALFVLLSLAIGAALVWLGVSSLVDGWRVRPTYFFVTLRAFALTLATCSSMGLVTSVTSSTPTPSPFASL